LGCAPGGWRPMAQTSRAHDVSGLFMMNGSLNLD